MAEFKAGTREQVKNGQAQYVTGDIVSKDAINAVGGAATRTKAVTQVTGRSSSGRITNSQTVLYVEKNGTFQPAAIKKDGKWSYSDPEYPLMAGVADAELQKDLANPSSSINKTTNNGIKAELGKRMDVLPEDVDNVMGGLQNVAHKADEPSGLEGQPLNTETKPLDQLPKSQGGTKPNNAAAVGTRNSFGEQRFPSDLDKSDMDVIKFTMLEFKPRQIQRTGGFGKILQIVQHSFTTGQFTTTSNSFVDVTGFSQAITPTAASSKILVMLSCQAQTNPSGTYNGQCDMSINRSIDGGSYTAIAAQTTGNYIQETYASYHDNSININLLDSPSYTLGNAITYKMQVRSADTSVTTRVKITNGGITNGASKLILIEVAA